MADQPRIEADRHGPGRPASRPSKFTGQAKENIAEVFEMLGGVEAMARWASIHPTAFYKIYIKLIDLNIQPKVDEALKEAEEPATSAFERLLLNVLDSLHEQSMRKLALTGQDPSEDYAGELILAPTNGAANVDERLG